MLMVREAYLHILDGINETKILSENALEIEGDIQDYIERHVSVFFEQLDIFKTELKEGDRMLSLLAHAEAFQNYTLDVADIFYELMRKTEEIKPCDLLCLHLDHDNREYVAVLKLNLRTSYIHFVETQDQKITNRIVKQHATLPFKTQKVEEGFLIDLEAQEVYIKDKQITLEGNKSRYVQDEVLGISAGVSTKKAIDTVTKAAEKVIKKYHDQDYVKTAKVREMINEQLDEKSTIDLDTIVYQCFETQTERDAYRSEIESKGVDPTRIEVNENQKKKIKRSQKIKTASGVEINMPYEYIARAENLEIVNNPDGSVTIRLNNLGEIL